MISSTFIDISNLPSVEFPPEKPFDEKSLVEKKNFARKELARARRNHLVAIGPCALCGSKKDIHGHHPDYDRPRLIVWLCHKCHGRVHRKHKSPITLKIRADVILAIKTYVMDHRSDDCRNVSELTESLWIAYLRRKGVKLPPLLKNGR